MPSTFSRPFTFDRVVRMLITIAIIAAAVWLIGVLSNVLLPFCVACLVAYILEPFLEFNMRLLHLRSRVAATFVTLFEVSFFLSVLAYLFLPSAISEAEQLAGMVKKYSSSEISLPFIPEELHRYIHSYLNINHLGELIGSDRFDTLLNRGGSLLSGSINLIFHTLEWFLTFIYIIFVMIDYRRLMKGFRLLVPPRFRPVAYRVADDIKHSMNRYFRGQAILALCAAVFYCIGFSLVGLPLAILLGVLVGVLYMIPYFQYITVIPVLIVCLLTSMGGGEAFWSLAGKCALVYAVSQSVCDYILTPKIMGKALGLNPAIILLSLSVWGTLLGLIGMIIALPLTTLLLAYYEEYVINRSDESPAQKAADRKDFEEMSEM